MVRRAIIYETSSCRPCLVLLAASQDWDPACGAFISTEELDIGDWLNGGQVIASLDSFPGTNCYLRNGFDIVTLPQGTSTDDSDIQTNKTILEMFSINWSGNVLVIKRGCYDRSRAISICQAEISTINAIVQRYV